MRQRVRVDDPGSFYLLSAPLNLKFILFSSLFSMTFGPRSERRRRLHEDLEPCVIALWYEKVCAHLHLVPSPATNIQLFRYFQPHFHEVSALWRAAHRSR